MSSSGKLFNAFLAATLVACGMSDSIKTKDELAKETSSDMRLEIVSGNEQTGRGGRPLAKWFEVRVTDAKGRGVSGQIVSFDVVSGRAVIQETSDPVSDVNGQAFVGIVPDHEMAGVLSVEARISPPIFLEDRHRVLFSAQILPALGPALVIANASANGQVGVVGRDLPHPLSVRTQDEEGLGIPGQTVGFTIVRAPQGTEIASTAVTDSGGVAAVTLHLGPRVGAVEVRVAWPPDSNDAARTLLFTASAVPDAPASLVFLSGHVSGSSQACTVKNSNYAAPLRLGLTDPYGNPIGGWQIRVMPDANSRIDGLPVGVPGAVSTDTGGVAVFQIRAGDIPWERTYSRSTTIRAAAEVASGTAPTASATLQFTQPYFLMFSDGTFERWDYETGFPNLPCAFLAFCDHEEVSVSTLSSCWRPYGGARISAIRNRVAGCPQSVSVWGNDYEDDAMFADSAGGATGTYTILRSSLYLEPIATRYRFQAPGSNTLYLYTGSNICL